MEDPHLMAMAGNSVEVEEPEVEEEAEDLEEIEE